MVQIKIFNCLSKHFIFVFVLELFIFLQEIIMFYILQYYILCFRVKRNIEKRWKVKQVFYIQIKHPKSSLESTFRLCLRLDINGTGPKVESHNCKLQSVWSVYLQTERVWMLCGERQSRDNTQHSEWGGGLAEGDFCRRERSGFEVWEHSQHESTVNLVKNKKESH